MKAPKSRTRGASSPSSPQAHPESPADLCEFLWSWGAAGAGVRRTLWKWCTLWHQEPVSPSVLCSMEGLSAYMFISTPHWLSTARSTLTRVYTHMHTHPILLAQKTNWKLHHSSKPTSSHSQPPSGLLSPLASCSPRAGRLLPAWSPHPPHTQVTPFWPPPTLTCPPQSAEQPCALQPLLPNTFQNLLVNTSHS